MAAGIWLSTLGAHVDSVSAPRAASCRYAQTQTLTCALAGRCCRRVPGGEARVAAEAAGDWGGDGPAGAVAANPVCEGCGPDGVRTCAGNLTLAFQGMRAGESHAHVQLKGSSRVANHAGSTQALREAPLQGLPAPSHEEHGRGCLYSDTIRCRYRRIAAGTLRHARSSQITKPTCKDHTGVHCHQSHSQGGTWQLACTASSP